MLQINSIIHSHKHLPATSTFRLAFSFLHSLCLLLIPLKSVLQSARMSFFPEGAPCRQCGAMGQHKTNMCPDSPCVYCHRKDHVVTHCPTVPPCRQCGRKGHRKRNCKERQQYTPTLGASSQKKRRREDGSPKSDIDPLILKPKKLQSTNMYPPSESLESLEQNPEVVGNHRYGFVKCD